LAEFIDEHREEIVDEAEAFARSQMTQSAHMDTAALRDHLPEVLAFVVRDLQTPQTARQSRRKAEGHGPVLRGETAANTHGRLRAKSGFEVDQMIAEYRALRASVLRLWLAPCPDEAAFDEMLRFNEAIDQAIAESVSHFAIEAESWRQMFLGVLGHDLRGPLNVILLTSEMMVKMAGDTPYSRQANQLIKSGRRMSKLLDDLLDYSRASLGVGIRIHRADCALAEAVQEEVDELRIGFPANRIDVEIHGATEGQFDASRIREALNNLVSNAVKYGDKNGRIQVSMTGSDAEVRIAVMNEGAPLSAEVLSSMFEPLKRGPQAGDDSPTSLGLGLFIVREIVKAHGGDVEVASADGTTTFTMHLARR
jgi:signal transduction histidine kinase